MTVLCKIRDVLRNIVGRYNLFRVLFKWDHAYRKEIIVTGLALALINYSILDLDSYFDYIALTLEVLILSMQLGSEISILPRQYRPHYNGVSYSGEVCTHITNGDRSFPISSILPPPSEDGMAFYNPIKGLNIHKESPLISQALNDHLMTVNHLPYEIVKGQTNFIYSVHQIRYLAIRVANKTQHTTNGEKLCLFASAQALMTKAPVPVRKSFYFDALLTAEAFRSRILRGNLQKESEVYTDMTPYYPADRESVNGQEFIRLSSDFYEKVSGHIGATTLLLSENRKIVMLFQGSGKAMEANKVMLGGSGSMDFHDIEVENPDKDLRYAITHSMARELSEETGMKKYFREIHENTLLTGFFHWMDRSGKPEFVGITKAGNIHFADKGTADGDEIVKMEEIPIEINKMGDFQKVFTYIKENKLNLSLSSLMALHRMMVIADYDNPKATETEKRIFKETYDFLFSK